MQLTSGHSKLKKLILLSKVSSAVSLNGWTAVADRKESIFLSEINIRILMANPGVTEQASEHKKYSEIGYFFKDWYIGYQRGCIFKAEKFHSFASIILACISSKY